MIFHHKHPYEPFIPDTATKLIIGTLPPPRFSQGTLKHDDVNFCYGSRDGLLWPVIDKIFNLELHYANSQEAIVQRKSFLISRGIGICDIVDSCERQKIDASDLGMGSIVLRDILGYLDQYPKIDTLLFTGGNSKNGPEYLFRRYLKSRNIDFKVISNEVPRIHYFNLIEPKRTIKTVSLTAPSGSANRAIGAMEAYKFIKSRNPGYNTLDFRVDQYKNYL